MEGDYTTPTTRPLTTRPKNVEVGPSTSTPPKAIFPNEDSQFAKAPPEPAVDRMERVRPTGVLGKPTSSIEADPLLSATPTIWTQELMIDHMPMTGTSHDANSNSTVRKFCASEDSATHTQETGPDCDPHS